MKPFKPGQKFTNGAGDLVEITDVTRFRIYYKITFVVQVDVDLYHGFKLPITYASGMARKSRLRESLSHFSTVN